MFSPKKRLRDSDGVPSRPTNFSKTAGGSAGQPVMDDDGSQNPAPDTLSRTTKAKIRGFCIKVKTPVSIDNYVDNVIIVPKHIVDAYLTTANGCMVANLLRYAHPTQKEFASFTVEDWLAVFSNASKLFKTQIVTDEHVAWCFASAFSYHPHHHEPTPETFLAFYNGFRSTIFELGLVQLAQVFKKVNISFVHDDVSHDWEMNPAFAMVICDNNMDHGQYKRLADHLRTMDPEHAIRMALVLFALWHRHQHPETTDFLRAFLPNATIGDFFDDGFPTHMTGCHTPFSLTTREETFVGDEVARVSFLQFLGRDRLQHGVENGDDVTRHSLWTIGLSAATQLTRLVNQWHTVLLGNDAPVTKHDPIIASLILEYITPLRDEALAQRFTPFATTTKSIIGFVKALQPNTILDVVQTLPARHSDSMYCPILERGFASAYYLAILKANSCYTSNEMVTVHQKDNNCLMYYMRTNPSDLCSLAKLVLPQHTYVFVAKHPCSSCQCIVQENTLKWIDLKTSKLLPARFDLTSSGRYGNPTVEIRPDVYVNLGQKLAFWRISDTEIGSAKLENLSDDATRCINHMIEYTRTDFVSFPNDRICAIVDEALHVIAFSVTIENGKVQGVRFRSFQKFPLDHRLFMCPTKFLARTYQRGGYKIDMIVDKTVIWARPNDQSILEPWRHFVRLTGSDFCAT